MHTFIRLLVLLVAMPLAAQLRVEPHEFTAPDGTKVAAELGELRVPENRAAAASRTITLRFVRFRSTAAQPGSPIVYLAGGPGGSGIGAASGARFPLFMALREFGDVIAFDQRGTGRSEPNLQCEEQYALDPSTPLDAAGAGAVFADVARRCAARVGVDLRAYHTRESAADLADLRKALGAEKLILWGISYGTHLSIAMLRDHGAMIERVILAGIEGPDETYKLPSDQQDLLEEIAKLSKRDLLASIRNVRRELERAPKTVPLTHPMTGQTLPLTVGALDLQVAIAQMLTGPESFASLPDFIARVEGGDWTALALAAARFRFGQSPSLMSIAMDCASGMTAERRARIAAEARETLLGDAINLPFPYVCEGVTFRDAGDAFRAPLVSDVPALLISGTLDGRTRPRQAEALMLGMPNATHLVIDGAGHSDPLFLSSPKILETMRAFLRGERITERRIELPPVELVPVRKVVTLPDDVLARYVGEYRVSETSTRRVIKAGSVLYTVRDGNPPLALRPSGETEFFYEGSPTTAKFEVDAEGRVVAMVVGEERAPRK